MNKITWTNITVRLGDLKPWPRNPRQINRDQARRLNKFWLNGNRPAFCFFVTRMAKSYQVAKIIRSFIIAIESVRRDYVMNVNPSRCFGLLSAILASPVVPIGCFSSLAVPVFSVFNTPSMPMNKRGVSNAEHEFCPASKRTANIFGVLQPRWWDKNIIAAISTPYNDFPSRLLPAANVGTFTRTMSLLFIGLCNRKSLSTYRACFGNSLGFDDFGFVSVQANAGTKKVFGLFQAVLRNAKGFAAKSAKHLRLVFSHSSPKKVLPAGRGVVVEATPIYPLGSMIKQENRVWVMLPRRFQYSTSFLCLQP